MENDWIAQNPHDLKRQLDAFLTALDTADGRKGAGLTAEQTADLKAKGDDLGARSKDKAAAESAYRASVEAESDAYAAASGALRALGRVAQAAPGMTDALRESAGLTVAKRVGKGFGEIPTVNDLVCQPRASGDNFLDWSGPTGSGITYNVEARTAPDKPWSLVGYTTRTAYLHADAGAGEHREYRVVPQRSGRAGEPSNVAVAY